MDSVTTKKGQKCLGTNCTVILFNGMFFCKKCVKIKDRIRVSETELKGNSLAKRDGLVVRKKIENT